MKKLIFTISIILVGITLNAQSIGTEKLYYNYKGQDGVIALKVPGFIIKLAGAIADLEGEERQLVRSLRSVSILTIEDDELYPGVNFTEEIRHSKMERKYEILMEVHDGDEDVVIACREKKGKIRDLLVVVGGDENVLVHVRGRMNKDLMKSLGGVTGIDQLDLTAEL